MNTRNPRQLYHKLFMFYLAILISVTTVLIGCSLSAIRRQNLERDLDYLEKLCKDAKDYIKQTERVASYLQRDLYMSPEALWDTLHYLTENTQEYLQYRLDAYAGSRSSAYESIEKFAANAFGTHEDISKVHFYSYRNKVLTTYYEDGTSDINLNRAQLLSKIVAEDLTEGSEFAFLKDIRDPGTLEIVGCMLIVYRGDHLYELDEQYNSAGLIVYNHKDSIVYARDDIKPLISAPIMKAGLENGLSAYVHGEEAGDYRVAAYIRRADAGKVSVRVLATILGIAAALLAAGVYVVHLYLKSLTGRVWDIVGCMQKVMTGDLSVRLEEHKSGDELDLIAQEYNEMCRRLELYIRKSYLAEIEQKNAELAALQSQINPHFLYNTLEAIRMQAICNGDREVGKMLYNMSVLFRSQLKEADEIPLSKELWYCRKYLELFECRYPDKFTFSIICPEEYLEVKVIKFILQPILENYFAHGIRTEAEDNHISITVEMEKEALKLVVEDNGQGMETGALRAKNEELKQNLMDSTKSIGISNVNRRIKAVYGDEYGLQIEKVETGGLRVVIRSCPGKENQHDEGNVS